MKLVSDTKAKDNSVVVTALTGRNVEYTGEVTEINCHLKHKFSEGVLCFLQRCNIDSSYHLN